MGNRINTDTNSTVERHKAAFIQPCMHWRQVGDSMRGNDKGDYHYCAVAISHDGKRAVLGSPWGDYREGPATVKVFDFNGSSWNEIGSFSGRREKRFGKSIFISGDFLAIGALASDDWGGNVEVYQYGEESGWKTIEDEPVDLFGKTISLCNGRIAIGAMNEKGDKYRYSVVIYDFIENTLKEISQTHAGAVDWSALVMEFLGECWQQVGQTIVVDIYNLIDGAVSLSMDGNVVAVGSPSLNGSVHIFRYVSLQRMWMKLGQTLHGLANCVDFGFSLSINAKGDVVAVGGRRVDDYVQVFRWDGNEWNQIGRTIFKNIPLRSFSLSSNGYRIAIGSYHSDGTNGCVDIFDYDGNDWVPRKINGPASDNYFGSSVSISSDGNCLAVGSILENTAHLTVHKFTQPT